MYSQAIPVMTSQSIKFWSWKTLTIGRPFLRISRNSSDPGISILDSSKNFKKSGFLGSGANVWKSLDCFTPIMLFFEWTRVCSKCAPSVLWVCSKCLGSLEVEESGVFHAQMPTPQPGLLGLPSHLLEAPSYILLSQWRSYERLNTWLLPPVNFLSVNQETKIRSLVWDEPCSVQLTLIGLAEQVVWSRTV